MQMLSNTAVPVEYGAFRDKVLLGEIVVNEEVSLQMNLIDDLIEDPRYYYDDQAIGGFIDFCEGELTTTDGEDLTLLPTFRLWAEDLFGWYEFVDEQVYNQVTRRNEIITTKRRLRNIQYLIVGRGAAKSMYAECVQAYGLLVDTSTTQQIVTAPTMRQAEETTQPLATAIARARGPLMAFLTEGSLKSNTWTKTKLASTKKGIQNFMTNSLIEIRPMTVDKLQGARSKYNTVDEWLSGRIREDVIDAIKQGASKSKDYVIVATSSEGTARNGPGDAIKMELQDKLHGKVYDPHVSIWYYKLDSLEEINDPDMWIKANPNLGATVSYSTYQEDVATAETKPSSRNDILAKRFGIPVEGFTYFFTYEETIPYSKRTYDNLPCVLGGDMSQGDDFCAFTFLFPLPDGTFGVKVRAYVSKSKVNKLQSAMQMKYDEFIKEDTLVVMESPFLDMQEVYDDMFALIEKHQYEVLGFGYDPYNAQQFVDNWITDNGEYGTVVVRQGARTESVPMGEIKNLSEAQAILFDESLMSFSMGNAVAIQDNNGNLKLSKERHEEKIDNVAALIDAWVAYKNIQEAFM